jgi:uncharacterized membrane protein YphA (DoxX/SURF4 family)
LVIISVIAPAGTRLGCPVVSYLRIQPEGEGDLPLATSTYRYGTVAVVALVALRLAIGWHFYREGADKLIDGHFTSVGFFKTAKGPLAPMYRYFIWDRDGRARLDKDGTLDAWTQYRQQVVKHYAFDADQQQQAEKVLCYRSDQLKVFFEENKEDVEKYFRGLERRDQNRRDQARRGVESLRGQSEQIEKDLAKDVGPWLSAMEQMWKGYEEDLNNLATPEQATRGWLKLGKPGRHFLDNNFIDPIIPYFDLLVGVCLILGLGTRVMALAGAGFLASIVGTQWPGAPGAIDTYYQVIEMFAMLVLAVFGAGRFAGLDFFLERLWPRCCKRTCCVPKHEPKMENSP